MARPGDRRAKNGGPRPGSGRKPKPTDPLRWSKCWAKIDTEITPAALDKLHALVLKGDKDAIFYALRMAGFVRTYADAQAALAGSTTGGGGLSVTFASPAGVSISLSSRGKSESYEPSSPTEGDT